MKWRLINKAATKQPKSGGYRSWKEILSKEGFHQCVYCAISEASFGGIRNFHVEHYKPQKKFPALENVITNLFFACSICNSFKNEDWPIDPPEDFSASSYPDPSVVDYSTLFQINNNAGLVTGLYTASKYIVERLYLNRPQLIVERRTYALHERLKYNREQIDGLLQNAQDNELRTLAGLLSRLGQIHEVYRYTIPYSADDVKKK